MEEKEAENEKRKLEKRASAPGSFMHDNAATLRGQMTLEQSSNSQKSYHKESERYKAITRKLAIFVGSTNVPNQSFVIY